jgi:hypothetical protein
MLGLVVIITIVKLTSNGMRKLKHARRLGQCEEHLSSKEGLIPEMSDPSALFHSIFPGAVYSDKDAGPAEGKIIYTVDTVHTKR